MADLETTEDTDSIRDALAEIDASFIPDATIKQKLAEAEYDVNLALERNNLDPDSVDQTAFDLAVLAIAARRSFNATPAEVRRQALDTVRSYDIQELRAQLRRNVENAWARLGIQRGGTSAAFVDTTTHAPGGDTAERRQRRHDEWEV